jgi:hypothetical protein
MFEISSSDGGEYDVHNCLLGCTAVQNDSRPTFQRCVLPPTSGMTAVAYIPEDNSEHYKMFFSQRSAETFGAPGGPTHKNSEQINL